MAYPLPDLPEDNTTICVVLPNSPEWRQLYIGALQQLTRWWYYDVQNAEQAEDVVQRIMDCQWQTTQDFESCVDMSCDDVADCIENNQSVIDAINSIAESNGNSDVNTGVWKDDNFSFDSGGTCDNDSLYGSLDEAISFLNEKAEDMIEQWEVATNVIEFLGVIEDVPFFAPLLDALGSELATDFVEYMFDSLAENYLANYTVELEDIIECNLYCWVKDGKGCAFSITDIAQFFAEQVFTSITPATVIEDIISYVILGSWSGDEFVYAFMYIVSGSLAINKLVAGQSWNSFQRRVLLAEPSTEHQFCECDNEWVSVLDFTANDLMTLTVGTWENGVGYHPAWDGSAYRIIADINFDEATVTSIEWDADVIVSPAGQPASGQVANVRYRYQGNIISETDTIWSYNEVPANVLYDLSNTDDGFSVQADRAGFFVRPSTVSEQGSGTIRSMTLRGTGTKPSQLP